MNTIALSYLLMVRQQFIDVAIHQSGNSSKQQFIEWLFHQSVNSSKGQFIEWLFHQSGNSLKPKSSNDFFIECTNSSKFQNCIFSGPSRSNLAQNSLKFNIYTTHCLPLLGHQLKKTINKEKL